MNAIEVLVLIVGFIVVAAIGFVVGYRFCQVKILLTVARLIRDMEARQDAAPSVKSARYLRKEVVDNSLLFYEMGTEAFVCQGNTIEQSAVNFNSKYPNEVGVVVPAAFAADASDLVYFVDGKVEYGNAR